MGRTKGTYTLTSNIEPKVGAPLDARTVVPLKTDLTANGTFDYPYIGLSVFVREDNKKYTLIGSDPTVEANWREEGSGTSTSADHVTYDNTTSELESTNVQDAIDEIVDNLGTAAAKDFTTSVTEDSDDLVTSGAVYTALENFPTEDTKVTQTATTTDANYEILFSETADNTTRTEGAGKAATLRFNPSKGSLMEGNNTIATGQYSHAEGTGTYAVEITSHAEGYATTASGQYSHAEGDSTSASGEYSHTEGDSTTASGGASHAEGSWTYATGSRSHTEGYGTTASGSASHAEGSWTYATGSRSHTEGYYTCASGNSSHAEGTYTCASGAGSHAEGGYSTTANNGTFAIGENAHAEGYLTTASGKNSHAEGNRTKANSTDSHAEGSYTYANGTDSHAEGSYTYANGTDSHAEGYRTSALAYASHAEGYATSVSGSYSHAEGYYTTASGSTSHAEGNYTCANGAYSHAEGYQTRANSADSHAEGSYTCTSGTSAHAEGYDTIASGKYSHAAGEGTCAAGQAQTVVGKFNIADTTSLFIVGNGTSSARSNALAVASDGTTTLGASGTITSGNSQAVTGGAVYTALGSKLDTSLKGATNGVAELDANGLVPSSQLPSYVDDIIEVADYAHLPITGESGKIYVTLDTNKTYRWSGSEYVEVSKSLALGETESTAYRGDRGRDAYNHATETKLSTATASGLYKVAGTAQGHIASLTAVQKSDITALGIPGSDTNTHRPIQMNGTEILGNNTTALNLKAGSNVTLSNDGGTVTINSSYSDTDTKVTQTATTTNANYEVLFSATADNTTRTETSGKAATLRFNPSTGSLMEGDSTIASGTNSHAEGYLTTASGIYSHAAGYYTCASGYGAHAEGGYSTNTYIGKGTYATNDNAHAEGLNTTASGKYSHAEGSLTKATSWNAHSEGSDTIASGVSSHAEGAYSTASGIGAHAEGGYAESGYKGTLASGVNSHAEGFLTTATGDYSHAAGQGTCAAGIAQTVVGKFNMPDTTSLFIVGNGIRNYGDNRKNALCVNSDNTTTLGASGTITSGNTQAVTGGAVYDALQSLPSNDTWRNIKINGTEKLGTATNTGAVDFINGTNTTVSFDSSGNKIKIDATDTNTTYTFAGGTNKFTVTPLGGTAQDVTITPSIANNITGSGTSGYIAKFNGTNTITNGPAFGSATTTYLRNDGSWATPTDTNNRKAFYGTCDTAAGTAAKVVTLTDTTGWELKAGTVVGVKFTNTNTASNCTLNINNTGAKQVWYNTAAHTSTSSTIWGSAGSMRYYMYDGSTYWVWMGASLVWNDNTYDRNRYNAAIKCGTTAIVAANIIVGKDGVYGHLKLGSAFDISYPILYANAAIAANATGTDNYDIRNFTITTTQSITLTAYLPVFIKGTLNGKIFTPFNTTPLTQTIPTSEDGYYYIYLGNATSTTAVYLQERHPIFAYRYNQFAEITWNSQFTSFLKPVASNTTPSFSSWSIPSGCYQVWGQRWTDNRLKYTPSGGSETTVTDTGDWTMWLSGNGTSNAAEFNMRIDGTYYGKFNGNLSGNASSATKATQDGDGKTISSTYLKLAGGTMTGSVSCTTSGANLTWGNITIYGGGSDGGKNSILIGNDAVIGDCNVGGYFGIKPNASGGTNAGIRLFNNAGTMIGGFGSNNGTPKWINASGTEYPIGFYTATATSGQVLIADGTGGGLKTSGYTIAKSVPSNADFTNTHRPIQVNGTEILGNNTTVLNLKAGSNVTLTNSSGTVTIAATDTTYTAATAAPGNVASSSAVGTSTNYARQDHTHGISLATGDAFGQVKIAGTNVAVKGAGTPAYYGSNDADTNGWYKVCTKSLSGYSDDVITFLMMSGYNRQAAGIFHLHIRCENGTALTVASFKWLSRFGFNNTDLIVTTGDNTWSLYVNQTNTRYGRIQIRVLSNCGTAGAGGEVNLVSNTTKESATPSGTYISDGDSYLPLTGGSLTGGLEVKGVIAGDTGTTGHGLWSGGGYHSAYNNILLHGDKLTGTSGIAFISDKSDNGTITTINQPSDRAFIQYHAYGVTTATAENVTPSIATSGEKGRFVIGIGNDSDDQLWLQTPARTGLIHQVGATSYVIPDTNNTTGSVGSATQPVYVEGAAIKGCTYSLAKSVPADADFNDTKNTAGATDTSSKIYLIGGLNQNTAVQTYSDNEVYATSGVLTTKSVQVGGTAATMQYNSTNKCIDFVFA